MPTFFVIGAAKCGTTSLHRYLDLHPEISMSRDKEPRYFCRNQVPAGLRAVRSRDEYLRQFEAGTSHRGESSVQYAEYPRYQGIPERIHEEVPDAKLIYLVRDPVERIASHHVQMYASSERSNPVRSAGLDLRQAIGDFSDPANPYLCLGLYMTQIRQFLEFFPPESLTVVESDRLRDDRADTLGSIFEFLGVEAGYWHPGMEREANEAGSAARKSDLYLRLADTRALRRALDLAPRRWRGSLVGLAQRPFSQPVPKPALDPKLRARLEDYYREDAAALREFTGLPLTEWSI